MKKSLINYYDKVLERLETESGLTKQIIFRLMNIEDEKTLKELTKMTDKEIIEELKKDKYSSL